MPTISKENYLKTVFLYNNRAKGEMAGTTVIAKELNISKAAISDMTRRLAEDGLLDYKKYKGMRLTEAGKVIALQVIRKHRLWESFLHKVLDMSWGEVHDEAERLEHNTSNYLIDKIDDYLGHPMYDPHGSPIPDSNGEMPAKRDLILLANAKVGHNYQTAHVHDRNTQMMNYLSRIGLVLNSQIKILEKFDFDQSIHIELKGQTYLLSKKISNQIKVIQL